MSHILFECRETESIRRRFEVGEKSEEDMCDRWRRFLVAVFVRVRESTGE